MCDTLYVPANRNNGPAYFAKNSDRNPDEPQVMEIASATGRTCFLSRPVWMHGAEMGINSKGVVIGNEAVFSRWKAASNGVLGMDTLRSALEQSATAEGAVNFIAHSVEERPQGGNGAYKGKLVYHNSYLVADFEDAWIVETAGRRWAARRLRSHGAISNSYSLTNELDRADPETLSKMGPGYSWKKEVESRLYGFITKGDARRACSLRHAGWEYVDAAEIFSAMRDHGPFDPAHPRRGRRMRSVCMHGGGLVNNATTASMVVQLSAKDRSAVIWFTASSLPCLSLYRPAILDNGSFCSLWSGYDYREGSDDAVAYWKKRRAATARLARTAFRDPGFTARRDAAQAALLRLIPDWSSPTADPQLASEIDRIIEQFEEV
jgi:secernin